ncbi:MAG TPA: GNAT family N-acetyltransferase [Terriglobales bacterium]|nr:GNAT family N-acetyltransferase [Terriglobales bacterium]
MAINHTCGAVHKIRLAGQPDLPALAELLPELDGPSYSERFPGKTCDDFIRWKYLNNPAGEAAVGIALDGERVVSIVAGTPKRVRLGGHDTLAFELGDFITVPEHRKRGLFSKLINLVCDAAGERGATFAYVRPNDMSFPILASHLSFSEPAQIESRRFLVASAAVERKLGVPANLLSQFGIDSLLRRLTIPRAPGGITVTRIDRFGDDIDQLWMHTRDQYSFALVRDSRYLNWRFIDCPTPYRCWVARRSDGVAGYLVAFVARTQPIATILDLFTHPTDEDTTAALLGTALDAMLREGTQAVYTWTAQTHAESASSRLLKRACRLVQKPLLHFAVRPLKPSSATLPSSGWQLTAGDFDGF